MGRRAIVDYYAAQARRQQDSAHEGHAIVRSGHRPGTAVILCPFGHVVRTVEMWAGSQDEALAGAGTLVVRCEGALR